MAKCFHGKKNLLCSKHAITVNIALRPKEKGFQHSVLNKCSLLTPFDKVNYFQARCAFPSIPFVRCRAISTIRISIHLPKQTLRHTLFYSIEYIRTYMYDSNKSLPLITIRAVFSCSVVKPSGTSRQPLFLLELSTL